MAPLSVDRRKTNLQAGPSGVSVAMETEHLEAAVSK
jgi:hypothetical protein